jgi:hypothetical protein
MLRAKGCRVWDSDGREHLDATMALGAVSLGYGHPAVQRAVAKASGTGVDNGMLEAVLEAVGPRRMVWACDVTMDTGLAKPRCLESLELGSTDLNRIRSGNAKDLFPAGVFEP